MDLAGDFFSALRRMNARDSGPEAAPDPAVHVAARPEIQLSDRITPAIGLKGIALIKRFEGCARRCRDGKFQAYPDPGTGGAPWTIGWGATGPGIASGTVWSQAECDARLARSGAQFLRSRPRAKRSALLPGPIRCLGQLPL